MSAAIEYRVVYQEVFTIEDVEHNQDDVSKRANMSIHQTLQERKIHSRVESAQKQSISDLEYGIETVTSYLDVIDSSKGSATCSPLVQLLQELRACDILKIGYPNYMRLLTLSLILKLRACDILKIGYPNYMRLLSLSLILKLLLMQA
ncbi:hypothetical protein MKW98_013927 [Papaver atlanticum]|uniref:Uncharacterized protein n=1 Tax=Papaver atlanticum TaxID=357466 RepID=A0AAD4SEU8_9MAGN|nr:hypothetical protein MKW98_013927 [Papaver atlanticum]